MRRALAFLFLCLFLFPLSFAAAGNAPIMPMKYEDVRITLDREDLLEVHLINVGTADCILLRMGGKTMMIDSGLRKTSDRIFAYLEKLGIDRLDYAFLSHPHDDHLGGYLDVLAGVPVGLFLSSPDFFGDNMRLSKQLRDVLDAQNIPQQSITSGYRMDFGRAMLTFYQWTEDPSSKYNDRSMVVLVEYGDRSILFAADVENNGQRAMARLHGDSISAEILKMPHHGINTFERAFYDAVTPSLVTFSNTKDNIQRTLTLTKSYGADCMLTTKGTIVAVTSGMSWQVWQIPFNAK